MTASTSECHIFLSNDHRDACICWLLGMHPVTPRTLVSLRWFLRKREAHACLHRLEAEGRIHPVGSIRRWLIKSEQVFCGWRPHPDHLAREVQLTTIFLRLDAAEIQRGPFVPDQTIRPDAQLWINGQLHYLELDRGPDDARPIAARLSGYEGCPHPCLWVCTTEERAETLRRHVEPLRGNDCFTAVAQALADPHAAIWQDVSGSRAALPREAVDTENVSGSEMMAAAIH